jgi:hypothetical protein
MEKKYELRKNGKREKEKKRLYTRKTKTLYMYEYDRRNSA